MTTPGTQAKAQRIFAHGRRFAVLSLIALAIGEAAAMAWAALALGALIGAAEAGAPAEFAPLIAAALTAGALLIARQTLGEWIGMHYVNACRQFLAHHAIATAAAGRPRRLGAMAVRMTSDLNALRDWVANGLSEIAAAAAGIAAGFALVTSLLGPVGLGVALAACAPALAVALTTAGPLWGAWRALRKERGRVSALAGDIVLSAATLDQYDLAEREVRRLSRRGRHLRGAAVRRRALAAATAAGAALCISAGAIAALVWAPALQSSAWAVLMMGLGFIAAACSGLARAMDGAIGFRVAQLRMARLADDMAHAEAIASAANIEPLASKAFETVAPAHVHLHSASSIAKACVDIEAMAFAHRRKLLAGGARARDVARWAPIVAPSTPLVRAGLGRNLAVRRVNAKAADMRVALKLVGLESSLASLTRRLDPAVEDPDSWTQARLRLARAIVHRPRLIFVADPLIALDPARDQMLAAIAQHTGAAIITAASSA